MFHVNTQNRLISKWIGRFQMPHIDPDSKELLEYISNESKRFHVFVVNRVQQIRDPTLNSGINSGV